MERRVKVQSAYSGKAAREERLRTAMHTIERSAGKIGKAQ